MVKLIEVAPGKWRVDRPRPQQKRSDLPRPYVISDIMPPTEQVDGKFYTSKREFRAVGRANGLVEIGTEKLKPKTSDILSPKAKEARRRAVSGAIEKFKSR
jgi:hypothetical protein